MHNTHSSFFLLLLSFLFVVYGCNASRPESTTHPAPYPPVTEQRAQAANKPWVQPSRILDSTQIIEDLEFLSSDTCAGRLPGTAGHAAAMDRILLRMRAAGVDSFASSLVQSFPSSNGVEGKNIIGWIRGTTQPEKYIVLSAHYDHLGRKGNGATYYGADDNASGVACLLSMAAWFKKNGHPYSLIFAAFDKEESRFEGAHHFVKDRKDRGLLQEIQCNLNMDMIARSDKNELFVSGVLHTPRFLSLIHSMQPKTNVRLLMGHDGTRPEADWTHQSDHSAFHEQSIPFLYLGVEDHADYHQPTDTPDRISYTCYIENCNLIALLAEALRS